MQTRMAALQLLLVDFPLLVLYQRVAQEAGQINRRNHRRSEILWLKSWCFMARGSSQSCSHLGDGRAPPRRLYELRYGLRIDMWKTSNLGRLVSLFSHLRNEKLPSDNVCVCQFSSLSSVPMSSWFLISPLYQLPIGFLPIISAISPSQVYPHPSVGAFASRAQVQLDWSAPSTEDLDLCVRGINLAGEEVAQMRLSKEDRPGSRERSDRGI